MKSKFSTKIILILSFSLTLIIAIGLGFFAPRSTNIREYLREKVPDLYLQIRDGLIYPILNHQVIGATRRKEMPYLKLVLSRKDVAHFEELYRQYESEGGQEFYSQNNRWRSAKLFYNGEEYKIKIRSHGQSPTGHRAGEFISYAIKLKKGNQINNTTRFNLLVHERINARDILTDDMAEWFHLLYGKREEVVLKINNWDKKLYFFEYRLNADFMEAQGKASYKIFSYQQTTNTKDKSLIYTVSNVRGDMFDKVLYELKFKDALQTEKMVNQNGFSIRDRYIELNQAISENDYQKIALFFNSEYITSFNSVRMMLGHIGHGSVLGNLHVFFNMADGKFYPVFTRDHIPDYLSDNGFVEKKINTWQVPYELSTFIEFPLFHVLSQNDQLRQKTYVKIYQFIKKQESTLPRKHSDLIVSQQKLYYLGWLKEILRWMGVSQFKDITGTNFKILKKYFSDANPEILLSNQGNRTLIRIKPGAMAALAFQKFRLMVMDATSNTPGRFSLTSWYEQDGKINSYKTIQKDLVINEGKLDLLPLFSEFTFFNGLSPLSEPQDRIYSILIDKKDKGSLSAPMINNPEITLKNKITGLVIQKADIKVEKNITEVSFRIPEEVVRKTREGKNPIWKKIFPNAYSEENKVIIPSGSYQVNETIIFPEHTRLILKPGTRISIAENIGILVLGALEVHGSEENPVVITSIKPDKPFGSFAVLGTGTEISSIDYLHVSNGSEKWMNGAYFSAAFSIHYNKNVTILNSLFENGRADDGVNIKYANVRLVNNTFRNNFADQVDLDYCQGKVLRSRFLFDKEGDSNGDGLDISGSLIYAEGNLFQRFNDKGVSIGEKSRIFLKGNHFEKNNTGIAVKDLSSALFYKNVFMKNINDIRGYQKKKIFGGGRIYLIREKNAQLKIRLDKKSRTSFLPDDLPRTYPWLLSQPENIEKIFEQIHEIESL
jgi:hypothetical protein